MKQTQKTILEKARPVFKRTTQPIISAGSRPYETGVQYTIKMRRVCCMGRAIDQENRRLSNGHATGGQPSEKKVIELQAFRPRLRHEYGEGLVLAATIENEDDPKALAALLSDMQRGYIKIILSKE